MFKKINKKIKSPELVNNTIFPQAANQTLSLGSTEVESQSGNAPFTNEANRKPSTLMGQLLYNSDFMNKITDSVVNRIAEDVTSRVLDHLKQQYNLEPTSKYKDDVAKRHQYLQQLDSYLLERKQINTTVANELQQFLDNTYKKLHIALGDFTQSITDKIKQAEDRYGIDVIKNTLLATVDKQSLDDNASQSNSNSNSNNTRNDM